MVASQDAGPIAQRIADSMVAFKIKYGRDPVEIGLGFSLHVQLLHEMGAPYDGEVEKFGGVKVTQPVDLPTNGCAIR